MPRLSARTRFLARGSVLLFGFLLLWLFFLRTPLLLLLRGAFEVSGSAILGISPYELLGVAPTGEWTVRVPVTPTVAHPPQFPGPALIHSIDFDIGRRELVGFTFSLPVFWSILLAAPGVRRNLRPLILGTIIMAAIEVGCLLLFVEISAQKSLGQLTSAQGAGKTWVLAVGEYLVVNALPYVAPLVVTLCLHRQLRIQLFGWTENDERHPSPKATPRRR
jgi:hypothetical protein